MKMEILLSCMHQKNISIVSRSNIQTNTVVINQCDSESVLTKTFINKQGNERVIKFFSTAERGLSRSRNMAIMNATSDICLIADDDEIFEDNCEKNIIESFMQHPKADVILFNVKNSGASAKKIFQVSGKVGYKKALSVVSPQIAFRLHSIKDKSISFDEEMGSGTGHGAGEETKFLFDCLNNKLLVLHLPIIISTRVKESKSQWFKGYTPTFFLQRGWATKRYLGKPLAIIYALYYTTAKYKTYKKDTTFTKALYYSVKGVFCKEI